MKEPRIFVGEESPSADSQGGSYDIHLHNHKILLALSPDGEYYKLARLMASRFSDLDSSRVRDEAMSAFTVYVQHCCNKGIPLENPQGCLYRMVQRIANGIIRYRKRSAELDSDLADSRPNPESIAIRQEEMQRITTALSSLSLKLRTVFILKEVDGWTIREIAAMLGISVGTAKSRWAAAKAQLQRNPAIKSLR